MIADLRLTSIARDRHAQQTGQLLTKTQAIEQAHAPPDDLVGRHHRIPPEMSENSVVRGMSIMYVSCASLLGHKSMALTCGYSSPRSTGRTNQQVTEVRVQVPLGHKPFGHV